MDEHHGHSTSSKSDLLNLTLSCEEFERLRNNYNRQTVPIIDDETFYKWLHEVATSGPVDEPKLDLRSII